MPILNEKDEPRVFVTPFLNATIPVELNSNDVYPEWVKVGPRPFAQYIKERCPKVNPANPFEYLNDYHGLLNEPLSVDYTQ